MKSRTLIRAILIALVLTLGLETARAQSLGLAPAQVIEKFKPGVPFQFELSTVNDGPTAVELHVQITDFWYNQKNEKVFAAPGTSPHSAANWIQFVPERFEVAPGGTQKMRAIVTPPSDARGGYYATLFVESKPQLSFDKTSDGRSVFTNMRIGCLVMLSAQSTEQFQVELSNVNLTPPTASQGLKVTFDLQNASNSHIFPLARLAVLNAQHKLVAKAESELKRFLPGQKDSMEVHWSGSLAPGDYTAVLVIPYGEDKTETRQIPFKITEP